MKVVFDVHCSFLIRTNRSLEDITSALAINPTRTNFKGDRPSKLIDSLETNLWEFEQIFRDYSSIEDAVNAFISGNKGLCGNISKCDFTDEICLRLFVQSDYAQISTVFSTETLFELYNLGVPVELSIFSWGKA